eukprot:TRINITY_DN88766_c0_g1_i1.p1 TRINITY_DN88766_c0_g1~~TRINITY_DN88766_c0_g1_i1.p1  ORF type:complete len:405 (-),score=100.17 TRINITY_DN88766_c0_g1_i1:13-1191(-)
MATEEPCQLCGEQHPLEDWEDLTRRLATSCGQAGRPRRLCALKRLCTATGSGALGRGRGALRGSLRGLLLGQGQGEEQHGREAERLLAFELLGLLGLEDSEKDGAEASCFMDEEIADLGSELLRLLELRWKARGHCRFGLEPLVALLVAWTGSRHLVADDVLRFTLGCLSEADITSSDGIRPQDDGKAEEESAFFARLSHLGRIAFALLPVGEEGPELLQHFSQLHHACFAGLAAKDGRAQAAALEILASLCGKDSDLTQTDGLDLSGRCRPEQLWLAMADAAEEHVKAKGLSAHPTPWSYWVIPLLQKEPPGSASALIDACGFVACCAGSPALVAGKALLCRDLLEALRALSQRSESEEVRQFADATGRRCFQACFRKGASKGGYRTSDAS